ncbi:Solute carrier family 12 member 2 [Geodia barretti]|uniref:Solute carrier family 12 member 2 n=1 Tax=Geodia barretti TaxID=519541 RepID=A0AA35W6M6_GEOBA|nr:Solute carrier family 12 member 2 [Geodia barretti]
MLPQSPRAERRLLGTFGGVFTPSVLTILGIILFRRLGYVVGAAGLLPALGMLALATAISVNTSMSLSAIATNRKVGGGGDYYLISRSLGVEYGGALGVLLFLAQAVSVAFYCVGFGEAVAAIAGGSDLLVRVTASIAAVALFALAYAGADLATRLQYVIMALLVAALASFFLGAHAAWDPDLLRSSLLPRPDAEPQPFLAAVRHFLSRGNRLHAGREHVRRPQGRVAQSPARDVSGGGTVDRDLRGGDSHVRGRPAASRSGRRLRGHVARGRSAWLMFAAACGGHPLVGPGVVSRCAEDSPGARQRQLFKGLGPFAVVDARTGNPRRAVILTGIIAMATIAAGDLNAIASVVSMFFLTSYGLLNYAKYVEAHGAGPSFRPRFRFYDARASLLGTCLCGIVMPADGPDGDRRRGGAVVRRIPVPALDGGPHALA